MRLKRRNQPTLDNSTTSGRLLYPVQQMMAFDLTFNHLTTSIDHLTDRSDK